MADFTEASFWIAYLLQKGIYKQVCKQDVSGIDCSQHPVNVVDKKDALVYLSTHNKKYIHHETLYIIIYF